MGGVAGRGLDQSLPQRETHHYFHSCPSSLIMRFPESRLQNAFSCPGRNVQKGQVPRQVMDNCHRCLLLSFSSLPSSFLPFSSPGLPSLPLLQSFPSFLLSLSSSSFLLPCVLLLLRQETPPEALPSQRREMETESERQHTHAGCVQYKARHAVGAREGVGQRWWVW